MASLINSRLVTRGALALGLLIRAAAPAGSLAQAPASSPSESKAPSQKVTYEGGQLTIRAYNVTLAEVLQKVAALTGVKIELPEGTPAEQLPVIEAGPGPARQVLADLLSDSAFDYLIQGSDADNEKLVSVMLLLRGKSNGPTAIEAAARPPRGPLGRGNTAPVPQEALVPDPPAASQPEITTADANAPTPPAQPDQQAAAPAQPNLSTPPAYGQPLQTNIPKTFPVAPPATMDQQTVNTQLLQMYQQRVQQIQQGRTTGNN